MRCFTNKVTMIKLISGVYSMLLLEKLFRVECYIRGSFGAYCIFFLVNLSRGIVNCNVLKKKKIEKFSLLKKKKKISFFKYFYYIKN